MKRNLIFLFLMTVFFSASAQQIVLTGNKGLLPIKGGKQGKTYAVIVRTALDKRNLVEKTTDFLSRYGIVDKGKVNLNEIDEATSEYVLPILIRQPIYVASGMMGVKFPVFPVKLYSELRFEFHDNGGVMIVVQNMSETCCAFRKKIKKRLFI